MQHPGMVPSDDSSLSFAQPKGGSVKEIDWACACTEEDSSEHEERLEQDPVRLSLGSGRASDWKVEDRVTPRYHFPQHSGLPHSLVWTGHPFWASRRRRTACRVKL